MAALLWISPLFAHGGVGGAIIEVSVALLIVGIGLAAWLGGRKDREQP